MNKLSKIPYPYNLIREILGLKSNTIEELETEVYNIYGNKYSEIGITMNKFPKDLIFNLDSLLNEKLTDIQKYAVILYFESGYSIHKISDLYSERVRVVSSIDSALRLALSKLRSYKNLKYLIYGYKNSILIEDYIEDQLKQKKNENGILIDEIPNLSVRAINCLRRNSVKTVEDVYKLTFQDLHNMRNLGKKTIKEIVDAFNLAEIKTSEEYMQYIA